MTKKFKQIPGIYKITCNNKVYIGSSINLSVRITAHKGSLNKNKHHNCYLQSAWNKYGKKNFLFEIIEQCNEDELLAKEEYWMNFFNSHNAKYGFNMESFQRGRKRHSDESRLKIGASNKGKRKGMRIEMNSEQREKFMNWIKQPKSEDHKKKISIAHTGKKRGSFSKEWVDKIFKNRKIKVFDIYKNKSLILINRTALEAAKLIGVNSTSIYLSVKESRSCKLHTLLYKGDFTQSQIDEMRKISV